MLPKKYLSGSQKRKRLKLEDQFIESQKGAIHKWTLLISIPSLMILYQEVSEEVFFMRSNGYYGLLFFLVVIILVLEVQIYYCFSLLFFYGHRGSFHHLNFIWPSWLAIMFTRCLHFERNGVYRPLLGRFSLHCSSITIKHVKLKIYHQICFRFVTKISVYILQDFIYGLEGLRDEFARGPSKFQDWHLHGTVFID